MKLACQQREESILNIGLAAIFSTAFLTSYVVFTYPPVEFAEILPYPGWEFSQFGSLVIIVLILFPIIVREVSFLKPIMTTSLNHSDSYSAKPTSQTKLPGRYTILGFLLALLTLGAPFFLIVDFWFIGNTEIPYATDYRIYAPIFYVVNTIRNIPEGNQWRWSSTVGTLTVADVMFLFNILALVGMRILFVFEVIRAFRGLSSRKRLTIFGVLSFAIPVGYFNILSSFYFEAQNTIAMPLPIVFLIGAISILILKPAVAETRMDTKLVIPTKQEVNVPRLYVLKSKAGSLASRIRVRFSRPSDAKPKSNS